MITTIKKEPKPKKPKKPKKPIKKPVKKKPVKKIVNNFKNELEKIKQKLNKDFYKYSQIEKEKNKNNNIVNFHYMNNSRNEPKKSENEYNELKEDIKIAKENIDNIINRTEEKDEKTTTEKTNSNTSIFTKIPSLEELKMKYGINLDNKPSSIKEITIETNMSKFNRIKDKDKDKDLSYIQKKYITEKSELNDNKIMMVIYHMKVNVIIQMEKGKEKEKAMIILMN